jgi:predicted CXXCH cytochrome family protein
MMLAALLAIVIGAWLGACGSESSKAPGEVPVSWAIARLSPGHVAHVGKSIEGRAIECSDCHDTTKGAFTPRGEQACAKCHEKEEKTHHAGNDVAPTNCLSCHAFAPTDAAAPTNAKATCTRCHAAPAGKLAHHATDDASCTTCHAMHEKPGAKTVDCTSCHAELSTHHGPASAATCTSCHAPHTAASEAKTQCIGCHEKDRPATHLTGHDACTSCHAPHAKTKEDTVACVKCHASKHEALTIDGHTQCTGCHAPHAPKGAASSCTGCHGEHRALAASWVKPHADCTSCHDAHRPNASPEAACARCHSDVHPEHGGANECIKCHAPHPRDDKTTHRDCTACHGVAHDDHALHAGATCTDCHRPHEFPLALDTKSTLCARCHMPVAAKVATGHADCTSCHGAPHTPSTNVDCAKCHAAEAKSPRKGHAACVSCHASHTGSLVVEGAPFAAPTVAAIASFCASCHAEKPKQPHGAIAGGCETCHRPHGSDPAPICTSCHAPASLPGLHTVGAHEASCASCHSAHTAPASDRTTCTSTCHLDRRTHQPDATSCKGCHIFRD